LTSLREDLLGALDGQRGDLLAQRLAGLDGLLLGFGAGLGDDLGTLPRRRGPWLPRPAAVPGARRRTRGRAASSRAARQLPLDALVGRGEVGLGLVGRGQAFGDLPGTLVQAQP
jgi:hypothetical protein